jgi:hypothetical protein
MLLVPDVLFIIHWGVPKSALFYWQEVGRAWRDGVDAYAIMYAYGRSLVHSLTNPKFIKTIQGILNDGHCNKQIFTYIFVLVKSRALVKI